jgi:hypothetical protein
MHLPQPYSLWSQPAPGVAAPPAQVVFRCTPAQAKVDLLDYELPGDAKIYHSATSKLSMTFWLSKPNFSILLAELGDCSNSASWTTTLQLNIGTATAAAGVAAILAVAIDLLKDYGQMTLPQLQVPVMAYQATTMLKMITSCTWH